MKIGLGEEENTIEIEKREPVKKDAKSLLNSASITSLSLVSLCHILDTWQLNWCKLESATFLVLIKTNTGYKLRLNNFCGVAKKVHVVCY